MTRFHSPWPLFADDLELARSWLRPQLQGSVSLRTGHLAISLGLAEALLNGVQSGELQTDADALRQWHFRVARLNGDTNPYRHLLPDGLLDHTQAAIGQSIATGVPLGVQLNGGIGDHLEALSLLLPWSREKNCNLNLVMSAERQKLIKPLLAPWDGVHCDMGRERSSGSNLIPVMALRAAVVSSAKTAHYRQWVMHKPTSQHSKQQLLCCWRAEAAGDRMSAQSRSVPWALAREFYERLQHLQPERFIVDITNWRDWEACQLQRMGVKVLDPRKGALLDLAQLCQISRVVTIDTALVHLCAAAGLQAELLLCAIPDERWKELHRPEHHYGQLIRLWRSSQFGSWSAVLESLVISLATES